MTRRLKGRGVMDMYPFAPHRFIRYVVVLMTNAEMASMLARNEELFGKDPTPGVVARNLNRWARSTDIVFNPLPGGEGVDIRFHFPPVYVIDLVFVDAAARVIAQALRGSEPLPEPILSLASLETIGVSVNRPIPWFLRPDSGNND